MYRQRKCIIVNAVLGSGSRSEVQATSHIDRTFVMAAYDPTDVLSRLRKQREDASVLRWAKKVHRQPNLKVQVAPTFQTNNNVGSIPPPGSCSPYALGASPQIWDHRTGKLAELNPWMEEDLPILEGITASCKLWRCGSTLFHLLSRHGVVEVGVISTLGGRLVVETSAAAARRQERHEKGGAGNANFCQKQTFDWASTFFNRVASKVARGVGI